jgi:hypothetical protein
VPLTSFAYELYHSLSAIGKIIFTPLQNSVLIVAITIPGQCLRLTSDVIRKSLGMSILDPNNEYRLTSWLAQQEDQHRIVLYQCDNTMTTWSQRCVRQADCVLIVGLFERGPVVGKVLYFAEILFRGNFTVFFRWRRKLKNWACEPRRSWCCCTRRAAPNPRTQLIG